jgi:eukaryotic-like serine/threonine-protein kinase
VSCFDEDAIIDLIAGRLELDEAAVEHLAGCALCARLMGAVNLTVEQGKPDPADSPPASESQAITAITPTTPGRSASRPGRRAALEPGSVLKDTYQVRRLLGRGGMGEVYEVNHLRLVGRFAVKVLRAAVSDDEDLVSRFRREAQISSALRHPNIIQVFDFDRTADGCFYLAMEYLEGEDLAHLLAREGQLPLTRVLRLAAQIGSALAAAHRRGVVHRDLKPANVFIVRDHEDSDERVKVMDFGLSKWSSAATLDSSLGVSNDQALIGTPRYMAPEQASGRNREVTAAADQFAFAAIVYEMLAGTPAFSGDTLAQLLQNVIHGTPAPLGRHRPGLPPGFAEAITKALAKSPVDRFPSVQSFLGALLGGHARQAASTPRRRWRRWYLAGGFGSAAVGLAVWAAATGPASAPAADPQEPPAVQAQATPPAAVPAAPAPPPPEATRAPPPPPPAAGRSSRRARARAAAPADGAERPPAARDPPDAGPPSRLEIIPDL